jgi:anaerobic magnesium-protoporphyrin IX monomethyl ester cyclase
MTSRLDLLLINPGSRMQVYQALGNELAAVEPPVWAGMMASFVRGKGRSVEILDAEAERLTPAQVAERVEAASPRLRTCPPPAQPRRRSKSGRPSSL